MKINTSSLITQVNENKLETTIFTNQLGGASGVRGKGCGSCLVRFWDWLSGSGVSYDKDSVIERINTAFSHTNLKSVSKEFRQYDRDTLKEFKANLQAMQKKFNKSSRSTKTLDTTIKKIRNHLLKATSTRKSKQPAPHSAMGGPSAARVTLRKPKPLSTEKRVTARVSWAQNLAKRNKVQFNDSELKALRIHAESIGEEQFQFMVEGKIAGKLEAQAPNNVSEKIAPAKPAQLPVATKNNPLPPRKGPRTVQLHALITWAQTEAEGKGYTFTKSDINVLKIHANANPPEIFARIVNNMILIAQHKER